MFIYIILLLLAFFSDILLKPNKSRKGKKYYVVFMFGVIYLINALRSPEIGIDLNNYYAPHYAQFARIPWDNLQSVTISGDWELGFCAFCKLLTYISTDVQFFIAVSSAVIVLPYGYFIYKNSDDVVFGTCFYILYNLMFSNMNTIRQAMAVSIVVMGLGFLRDKKYVKYSAFVVLAVLFHKSALIAFLLLVVDVIKLTKKKLIVLLVALAVIPATYTVLFNYLMHIPFLSESYNIYESGMHSIGYFNWNSLIQFAVPFIVFLIFTLYVRPWKSVEDNSIEKKVKRLVIRKDVFRIHKVKYGDLRWSDSTIGYAVYIAAICRFFVFFVFVVGRLSQYFIPFVVLAFPDALKQIEDIGTRRIVRLGMYLMLIAYFLYIGFGSGDVLYGTVPYKFYWN